MEQHSLGLIETWGLTAAIEAGDAAVKAANVKILGTERIGAGLITIAFAGNVGAVKAAVDAGTAAAEKVGKVVSTLVIPRPSTQLIAQYANIGFEAKPAKKTAPQPVVMPLSPAKTLAESSLETATKSGAKTARKQRTQKQRKTASPAPATKLAPPSVKPPEPQTQPPAKPETAVSPQPEAPKPIQIEQTPKPPEKP